MHDTLYCGKRYRTLNVLDEGTRECLAIEVDSSLSAERVIRTLEQLKAERGLPQQLRLDNGPEFISAKLTNWCEKHDIKIQYIQPSKPQQNAFIERFNGTFRREFLNAYLFESLHQVRDMAWFWRLDYNEERTHESLGHLPPSAYRQQLENSSLEAVGLTAVVASALAKEGISANVIAAYHHDHVFVPIDKANQAMQILINLSDT